ncbi:MAG: hypothetical protein WAU45_19910 [Blastocatellia bacterium]
MVVSKTHTRLLPPAVLLSAALTFIAFASSSPFEDVLSDDGYYLDVAVLQRTGVLTAKGGVKVNGNQAKTGHTILSNSKIVTASDGVALVDLGPLGRIAIGEGTIITLVFTRESVHVKSECARTRIEVASGQVDVESPRSETLGAGDSKKYRGSAQAASRVAVFEIRCVGGRLGALRRTGRGILAAVEEVGEEFPPPQISPAQP